MASSPSPRPRSAPFSAHARGVPLFDRARLLDAPRAAARALLDLRDVGSSLFWFLSMQSWLALWATLITVLSRACAGLFGGGQELRAAAVESPAPRPTRRPNRPR
jgi:hypothetical protein